MLKLILIIGGIAFLILLYRNWQAHAAGLAFPADVYPGTTYQAYG